MLGANATGKDLKDVSAIDKVRAQDRNAAIACRQGLGALIAKLGEQAPAGAVDAGQPRQLERPRRDGGDAGRQDRRARRHRHGVEQRAGRGQYQIHARHSQAPARCRGKLSLGSYDHIALQLPGNPLGLGRDDIIIEQSNSTRTALLFANMGSSSLCSIDVAGSFGRDLAGQGEPAMVAFAVEWLTKLFGSDTALAVKKSSATRWNAAPYVLGAMSVAAPGGQPSRKILTEPIGCMFLAGEATHETLWGTVDGAWESGERAAEAALRKIGALGTANPAPAAAARAQATAPRRSREIGDAGNAEFAD